MKTITILTNRPPNGFNLILAAILTVGVIFARGQGTITFNNAAYFSGTNYVELGMKFGLVVPTPGAHDGMAISAAITSPWNTPYNNTPYMLFFRQFSPDNYVSLSLTNGAAFGLASVWLADPTAPSPSPVPITFVGHLAGGGSVTNTFTTPGGGATTFATYTFDSDFTAPVFTHVDVLAPRWAMDNLVFVIPEPGAAGLFLFGLLAVVASRRKAI